MENGKLAMWRGLEILEILVILVILEIIENPGAIGRCAVLCGRNRQKKATNCIAIRGMFIQSKTYLSSGRFRPSFMSL